MDKHNLRENIDDITKLVSSSYQLVHDRSLELSRISSSPVDNELYKSLSNNLNTIYSLLEGAVESPGSDGALVYTEEDKDTIKPPFYYVKPIVCDYAIHFVSYFSEDTVQLILNSHTTANKICALLNNDLLSGK